MHELLSGSVDKMLVEFLIFIFGLLIYKSHCIRNISTSKNQDELDSALARQISALLTLETGYILLTQSNAHYRNAYINFFLRGSNYPVEIVHKSVAWALVKSNPLNNFIIPSTVSSLNEDFKMFVRKKEFYFFIITDNIKLDYKDLWAIFHTAWKKYRTLHVYILTDSDGIIAYDPFSYDFTRPGYGAVVNLADRKNVNDMFVNLNGYPLNIEIFRSVYSNTAEDSKGNIIFASGADANVAYELAKFMNFSLRLQQPDKNKFGFLTENGTFNGALGRAISNLVDITFTTYFIKDYFTRDVEFTVAVYGDEVCVYVPKADRVPQSILPLFSLSTQMWICYFLSAFTCGVIWSAFRCLNLVLYKKRAFSYGVRWRHLHFMQIFVDTWIVWVRVGLRKFPKFDSEKFFLGSVCLVSVIFGAIFESSLATVYIRPLYYKDITTLQELDASGFNILYKYASMGDDTFANGSSALFTRLSSKMKFIQTPESMMDMMMRIGGFASITRQSSINLENYRFFAGNKLFKINEYPKKYTLAYILPRDSPFLERVNELLLRLLNVGLIDKWIDDMYFQAELDLKDIDYDQAGAKVLTMGDLQLPFMTLASGSLLGFLILLIEKCMHVKNMKYHSVNKKFYIK